MTKFILPLFIFNFLTRTQVIKSFITFEVYDVFGRKISELSKAQINSGEHAVYFNASNLASSLYFARLQTPNQ